MFLDGRRLPDASEFRADVVIIGAGAAGISIAKTLAATRLSVLLVESGGLDYDEQTQRLNGGENIGLPYADLTYNRLRFFGGTTGHWGGWCRPLDPIDFKVRAHVPKSGWPFGRDHLDAYYQRAQKIVEAGPYRYDDAAALEALVGGPLALKGHELTLGMYQYSPPTRFGETYRDVIKQSKNIKVLLHTTVLEIETDEAGATVTGLRLGCLNGRRHRGRGVTYVLAAGGIENPRLLLASNAKQRDGIGNRHGLVGRYFMEHPHIVPARILLTPRERHVLNMMTDVRKDGLHARPCFRPSESRLATTGLNILFCLSMHLEFSADGRPIAPDHPDIDGDDEEAALRAAVARLSRQAGEAAGGANPVEAMIEVACEQAPNPLSRVTLGNEKDAFGLPRVRVDWRVQPSDVEAVRQALVAFGSFMGRNRLGFVRLQGAKEGEWPGPIGWGNHHMGTTRMAADPVDGVVDANCKIHDMDNLYIAGSSVFPTSGAANPTLTIVALALRLADRLQEAML
jgi:choline dehydrogenase-like flavoprotein